MKRKRILSLDGGGIKGIILAQLLIALEKEIRKQTKDPKAKLSDYFDLIAGTSTGGIITSLLLTPDENGKQKYSAEDILKIYCEFGKEAFKTSLFYKFKKLFGLVGPKHLSETFNKSLKKVFGDLYLKELLKPCLIPAYNIEARKSEFFNSMDAKFDRNKNFKVRDICLGTGSAPTYFKPAKIHPESQKGYLPLIDGGLIANNPALCALTELQVKFGSKSKSVLPSDVILLSLGTGKDDSPILYKKARRWGAIRWLLPVITILMSASVETVDYELKQIFLASKSPKQYVRINSEFQKASLAMSDVSSKNIGRLKEEGQRIAAEHKSEIKAIVKLLIAK